MKDLFDALLVEPAVAAVRNEIFQEAGLINRLTCVGNQNACQIGLPRDRAERAENGGRKRFGSRLRAIFVKLQIGRLGFIRVHDIAFRQRQGVKIDARHRTHSTGIGGHIVKTHFDLFPQTGRQVFGHAVSHFIFAAHFGHGKGARVELQRLRLHNGMRAGRYQKFTHGRLRDALFIEPREFIEAPDVRAAEIIVADGIAPECARNRLKQVRVVAIAVNSVLTKQRVLGFGHQNRHGSPLKKLISEKLQ